MQLKSTNKAHVNGIGTLEADTWTTITKRQEQKFMIAHGYPVEDIVSSVLEVRTSAPSKKKAKEDS